MSGLGMLKLSDHFVPASTHILFTYCKSTHQMDTKSFKTNFMQFVPIEQTDGSCVLFFIYLLFIHLLDFIYSNIYNNRTNNIMQL